MGGCKTSLLRSHFFFDKHIPGGSRYRKVINGFYMAMRGQYLIPGRLGPGLPGPAWSRNRAVLPFALRGTASFNASSVWWFKVKWQAADMSWKMSWAQWGGTGWQGSFLLIFPVSDSSPRCRHGMQQRKRSAFVNLKAGPFGLRFREEVVGNTDPATAAEKSLRGIFHKSWAEPWTQRSDLAARAEPLSLRLGLPSQPHVGENAVHGSASPFEAPLLSASLLSPFSLPLSPPLSSSPLRFAVAPPLLRSASRGFDGEAELAPRGLRERSLWLPAAGARPGRGATRHTPCALPEAVRARPGVTADCIGRWQRNPVAASPSAQLGRVPHPAWCRLAR